MTTILLIDLSSIAHPIWHTSQGSTNPNECSIQTVARVRALASGQPHVAVCCDSGRSFRRDVSDDYKAQRPEADATLQHQIALAVETLKGDGFPVWAVKGFEADDLIASATNYMLAHTAWEPTTDRPVLAARAATSEIPDVHLTIASSDKDMLQLVSDRVSIRRVADTKKATTVTPDVVRAEYGIEPSQFTEWLILVGDSSDNIKGAEGIGPKTATAMLAKFGNLADFYAAFDADPSQFKPGTIKAMTEFRARMDTVRQLVTLRTDVPLPFAEVFTARVPQDVAVFEGEDGMEAGNGAEAVPANHALGTNQPAEMVRGDTVQGSERNQSDDRRVDPVSQGTGEVRRDGTNGTHTGSVQSSSLAVRDAEVLPPPSQEFGLQLEPRSLREAALLAQEMFKSRLFSAYGTYQGVLSTILAGRELGMQAMASLRAFHIIDGKPTMSADLIRALVLKSGHAEYFRCTARSATEATFVTKRKGDPEVSLTFSVEEGRRAWPKDQAAFDKSGWGRNPADMCVARASAKLARLVYADIVFNMYTPEEMEN